MADRTRLYRYAVKGAKYLLTTLSDGLPRARRLVVSAPLTTADGGDRGDFTVSVDGATGSTRGVLKLAGQLGGTADSPDIRGVRVNPSGTPVLLTLGDVSDGQVLTRSGSNLVGTSALGTGGGTMAGDVAMGGNKVTGLGNGAAPGDAATYGQLTSMINGLDWQASVINALGTAPTTGLSVGDRYLVTGTPAAPWSGAGKKIAQYNGTGWDFIVPNKGFTLHNETLGEDFTYDGVHPSGNWVSIGASVDHAALMNLATGNPHTQYQLGSQKDAAGGYAGLDSDQVLTKPAKGVRFGADPSTPGQGEVWVVGTDLKYRNNAGSPATEAVERQARRNVAGGYAGLGDPSGRVEADQAPAKSVYTSGALAIAPADIGAVATSRAVASGTGLSGGGALSADRTLAIAAFVGCLSKDVDPTSQDYPPGPTVHASYDIGADGSWLPTGVRLPPRGHGSLVSEVIFEFQPGPGSARVITNSTDANLDDSFQGLANFLMGDVTMSADSNGQSIRKIILQTRNTTGSTVTGINVGAFKIRAVGLPRGAGSAL